MKACYSCGEVWMDREPPGFSVSCEKCGEFLHCCSNCRFHEPGRHNDCREPQAEMVRDKQNRNLCEWFQFADGDAGDGGASRSATARARLEELFGPPRAEGGEAQE